MWHTEDTGLGNPKDNPLTKPVKSKAKIFMGQALQCLH